ncbi:MAG: HupE/UreJ family protein [Myxococcota bacterium]
MRACVFVALVSLLAADAAGAHTRSRAKATFRVAEGGAVEVEVVLAEQDLFELADIDLSSPRLATAEGAAEAEGRFRTLLPSWLRLHADEQRCPLSFLRWDAPALRTVRVLGAARCGAPPDRLTVEWGLAAVSSLDVSGIARILAPGGLEHAAVFTRRSPKETFLVRRPALSETLWRFLRSGFEHILEGWDHLAFLLVLALSCATLGRLLLLATGFTLAHGVTLVLAALGIVDVPARLVETLIALSIAVAAFSSWRRIRAGELAYPGSGRALGTIGGELLLVVGFGLVHGLGLASQLRADLGDFHGFVPSIAGFQLGVEAGQLLFLALAFPPLTALGRREDLGQPLFVLTLLGLIGVGIVVTGSRALGF